MASNIDATQPPASNPTTAAMRANMAAAKTEIEALQNLVGDGRPGVTSGFEYFPACKMFLRCRETSGNTMTNEITGTSLIVGNDITREGNAAKISQRSPFAQIPESFGNSIAAGSHSILAFCVFRPHYSNGGFSVGGGIDPNNHLHALAVNESGVDINDDSDQNNNHVFTNDQLTLDVNIGAALAYTPGANAAADYFQTDGKTWITDSHTTAATGGGTTTLSPEIATIKFLGGTSVNHYVHVFAAYVFAFKFGIPPDIKTALQHMTASALEGNPDIYPGWIGRL